MTAFTDYDETIEWLYNLHLFGIKFGLKKVEKLLEYLDNPQDKLKIIHVGGTNGKGSVCAMLSSILTGAGYEVGLNTSPHLSEFTERITINGQQISKTSVIEYANLMQEVRERVNAETDLGYATYFEVVTAMALKYFADNDVDYVVLEVGLGGTFDATNIVKPLITVLTNIALDHTEHLGTTLTSVAENKAGIIKQKIPVITSNNNQEVLDVIVHTCKQQQCELIRIGKDVEYTIIKSGQKGLRMDYHGLNNNYSDLQVPLLGQHQGDNAALAITTIELLKNQYNMNIPEQAIREGLKSTHWPGRLEIMQESPLVLLDGAHNPAGAQALKEALALFDYEKLYLVFGCSEEKDIKDLLEPLLPLANKMIITQSGVRRAAKPKLILKNIPKYDIEKVVITPVKAAVKTALSEAGEKDLICICGSLFVVGEARELLSMGEEMDTGDKVHRIHY